MDTNTLVQTHGNPVGRIPRVRRRRLARGVTLTTEIAASQAARRASPCPTRPQAQRLPASTTHQGAPPLAARARHGENTSPPSVLATASPRRRRTAFSPRPTSRAAWFTTRAGPAEDDEAQVHPGALQLACTHLASWRPRPRRRARSRARIRYVLLLCYSTAPQLADFTRCLLASRTRDPRRGTASWDARKGVSRGWGAQTIGTYLQAAREGSGR